MADIIDFGAYRDPADMDKAELQAYLDFLRRQIAELDEAEPADMESEAYEDWASATRTWRTWWTTCWTVWRNWNKQRGSHLAPASVIGFISASRWRRP